MPSSLTIKLGDKHTLVSVATLAEALGNALDMLRSVETDFGTSDDMLKWVVVKASMRSPLTLTIAPKSNGRPTAKIGNRVLTSVMRGLKEIEDSATLPDHFKEETLTAAKQLIRAAAKGGTQVTLASAKKTVTPTPKTVQHIDQIVARVRVYLDHGTIEGTLQVVSVRGHKSFFVFERLTDHGVECLSTPEWFDQALRLLGKRVAVTGRIHYRNHKPKTINVESIKVFRDKGEFPQPRDIGPIDITDGLSSEEHVRRMRDAQ